MHTKCGIVELTNTYNVFTAQFLFYRIAKLHKNVFPEILLNLKLLQLFSSLSFV